MRWKLLVIMSVAAAIVAGALWSMLIAALFGPAAVVVRHDWLLPVSFLVPLGIAVMAGFFVYRHTARRRKTQAVITFLAVLALTVVVYIVAAQLLPHYLNLRPRLFPELVS